MQEETSNLGIDDVLELIGDFPAQPLQNKVIITTNTTYETEDGLNLSESQFDERQYVLAAGPVARDIKPGNLVQIDLLKMMVYVDTEDSHEPMGSRHGYLKIRPITLKGRTYALIPDSYIDAVINE